MKQLIGGTLYDTSDAENLGTWWASCPMDDPRYCEEQLFRMQDGRYFLLANGNEETLYADPFSKSEFGTWRIFPITEAYAHKWAKEKLNIDL